jgi:hypothetical protein
MPSAEALQADLQALVLDELKARARGGSLRSSAARTTQKHCSLRNERARFACCV